MKNRLILTLAFLFFAFSLSAQDFEIVSVESLPADMSAREETKTDHSDRQCALLRIATQNITPEQREGFTFKPDLGSEMVERATRNGEIWLWVSPGLKYLRVMHSSWGQYELRLQDHITRVEALNTYKITIKKTLVVPIQEQVEVGIIAPEGAVKGLFSVSPSQKVWFSKGNLQYQASTKTWRFAENQWDIVGTQTPDMFGDVYGTVSGSDNKDISKTYEGWIDLFGWGTSGYHDFGDRYNVNYEPWASDMTVKNEFNYYGYGPSSNMNKQDIDGTNYDWGVYNPINNGGNKPNLWRTLTIEEWMYLFSKRSTNSGHRFAKANVNGVYGVLLLPDDWNNDDFVLNELDNATFDAFDKNEITASQWTLLEKTGVVFLPEAGQRTEDGCDIDNGYYWSSSNEVQSSNNIGAWYWGIGSMSIYGLGGCRCWGHSVRLVQDCKQ